MEFGPTTTEFGSDAKANIKKQFEQFSVISNTETTFPD